MMAWRRAGRQELLRQGLRAAFVGVEAIGVGRTEPWGDPGQGKLCAELVLPGGAVLRIFQTASSGGQA